MTWKKHGYKYWQLLDRETAIAEVAGYGNNYSALIQGKWIGDFASEQQAIDAVNDGLK